MKVLWGHFRGTDLFKKVASESWEKIKSSIEYCAFDLEANSDEIREFALIAGRGVEGFQGEEQLTRLKRALTRAKLIVGHNVKNWDLGVVLRGKFSWSAFVWDTLEIEILLDPCRYAYSLHTTHKAVDDVVLTDKLFWNQLLRLSLRPELCEKLGSFLPKQINELLGKINKPWFEENFKKEDQQFFNELSDIGSGIEEAIGAVSQLPHVERTVVVAPKNLWGRLAKMCAVRFLADGGEVAYSIIDREKLRANPLEDAYLQMILLRFVESSVTPIVLNLAQYLRVNYFSDEVLRPYLSVARGGIECCDVDALGEVEDVGGVRHLYFIGCELGNRLHQYELPREYRAHEFIEKRCWVPLQSAAVGFCAVTGKEREVMGFEGLPRDAKNVWVERLRNGRFRACYTYDYDAKMKEFATRCLAADVKTVRWGFEREEWDEARGNIFVVKTGKGNFDSTLKRVSFAARNRARYWVYQVKLLRAIWGQAKGKILVYVVENGLEIEKLTEYAQACGFIVPCGSYAERLKVAERDGGRVLILISQEEFDQFVSIRTDQVICYVWDNMAVEKCRVKWKGQMPFGDEVVAQDGDEVIRVVGDGAIDCMRSAWALFEYRARFIAANCAASELYILDAFFEDYGDLAGNWQVREFAPGLWKSAEGYAKDLAVCEKFFGCGEEQGGEFAGVVRGAQIEESKETIRRIFLGEHGAWRGSQGDVLAAVLSREKDYLVSIPTGGGKSILFQGPALVNAIETKRVSIVITPLKALMCDQVEGLRRRGFLTNVDYLNGDKTQVEARQIYRRLASGELCLLYVTPERFRSKAFLDAFLTRITDDGGWEYFIFDEAHCISQWGQEFRPEYLNVMKCCKELKEKFPSNCVTLYSATVTGQIEEDIKGFLPRLERVGETVEDYNPIREHIGIRFENVLVDDVSRLNHIVEYIRSKEPDWTKSCMIIFCRKREQCEEVAEALGKKAQEGELAGLTDEAISYFHAGMEADERTMAYEEFRDGKVKILCATKAFGMGMDIPNIHYVLHYSPPQVLEDYLQEVGRAGRDLEMCRAAGFGEGRVLPAECMYEKEDFRRMKSLLKKGELTWDNLREMLKAVRAYILRLQTIDDTKEYPVVVPNTVWHKGDDGGGDVAFRVGLYWLEELGRLRLGCLRGVHLNIKLLQTDLTSEDRVFTGARGEGRWTMYEFIRAKVMEKTKAQGTAVSGCVQVAVPELRRALHTSQVKALNVLVDCFKEGLLTLEQKTRCKISKLRYDEVAYVLSSNRGYELPALHGLFEAARVVLSRHQVGQTFRVMEVDVKDVVNEVLEACKGRIGESFKTKEGSNISLGTKRMRGIRIMDFRLLRITRQILGRDVRGIFLRCWRG